MEEEDAHDPAAGAWRQAGSPGAHPPARRSCARRGRRGRLDFAHVERIDKHRRHNGLVITDAPLLHRMGRLSAAQGLPRDRQSRRREIPAALYSCHTAKAGEYIVEGHVPAPAIAKLLDENPDLRGIAVPGMPAGPPGMGGSPGLYPVTGFTADGRTHRFADVGI